MKKLDIFEIGRRLNLVLLVLVILGGFTACDDDDDTTQQTFTIEGNPTGLVVDAKGISTDLTQAKQYIVRSNSPWKIVERSEDCSWVRIFPMEGDADGIFRVSVYENTGFEARQAEFAFIVNGVEQPVLFRVDQDASQPYITIKDAEKGLVVAAAGGDVEIPVTANVEWTYSVEAESDWLSEVSISENKLVLTATENTGVTERVATINFTSPEFPDLLTSVVVTQSTAGVLLYEDFSWLSYGSTVQYDTNGETAITLWTANELDHGWTSLSGWCYARPGFIKLGKTNYGGDVVSPKLSTINGSKNVEVSFKATGYVSKTGKRDDTILYVGVIGAGEIEGTNTTTTANGVTYDVIQFNIENYPNSTKMEYGEGYDAWDESIATRTFKIKGATAETQICFFGGAFDATLASVGQGKNRIFLDDIVAVISE